MRTEIDDLEKQLEELAEAIKRNESSHEEQKKQSMSLVRRALGLLDETRGEVGPFKVGEARGLLKQALALAADAEEPPPPPK
jgi:hypothetical protein